MCEVHCIPAILKIHLSNTSNASDFGNLIVELKHK